MPDSLKTPNVTRSIDRRRLTGEQRAIIDEQIRSLPANLSVPQASKFFGRHRNTIYRWVDGGELIAFRVRSGTGKVMIAKESIRRFLERTIV